MEQVFLGTDNSDYEWKTEANVDRDYSKGWVYEKDGQLHWTYGQYGHFIYEQLYNIINEHIENWVFEYVMTNLD